MIRHKQRLAKLTYDVARIPVLVRLKDLPPRPRQRLPKPPVLIYHILVYPPKHQLGPVSEEPGSRLYYRKEDGKVR